MLSKKSLQIVLAFVLLFGLAAMGVAYGAWSDTLHVNGTVGTGTFNVSMDYMYLDYEVVGCNAGVSADGKILTVTVVNAYPGFHCGGGVSIKNLSSIPAKINGLVAVTNNVPAAFITTPPGLVWMTNAAGATVSAGGSFTLAAGVTGGGVMWDFTIPASETGHEGENYTFSYTFLAEQNP